MIHLAAAATYILVVLWPDGMVSRDPATTLRACQDAANAWLVGRALPLDRPQAAVSATCQPGNLFQPGWNCIAGYNCGERS